MSGINSGKFRPLEELCRLAMFRLMSIISYAIQMPFDADQLISQNPNFVNKSTQQTMIKTSVLNMDSSVSLSMSLSEQISDVLSLHPDEKMNVDHKPSTLSEIVAYISHNKLFHITVNQQIRHLFQWMLDLALFLTRIAPLSRLNQSSSSTVNKRSSNLFGFGLLADLTFLNEIRKAIVYMKLLFTNAQVNVPILPLRSSVQKDLLSDLFNIYSKIILKTSEGNLILIFY